MKNNLSAAGMTPSLNTTSTVIDGSVKQSRDVIQPFFNGIYLIQEALDQLLQPEIESVIVTNLDPVITAQRSCYCLEFDREIVTLTRQYQEHKDIKKLNLNSFVFTDNSVKQPLELIALFLEEINDVINDVKLNRASVYEVHY